MSEITDLSPTDASNTSISGTSAQGTAPASNIDNLIRAIAGMLARMNSGTAPLADTFTIGDNSDLTKRFRFEASGITAGQTRVITVPDANVTLVPQTFPDFLAGASLTSTDAGVSGPDFNIIHDSASPAVNDTTGRIIFYGKDSGGNQTPYSLIASGISDPTDGTEDGILVVQTSVAGTFASRAIVGAGLYMSGVADPGAGNIAASNFYIGSVAMQATQADMETGSSASLVVTPGRQHFHPGHPKFWAWVTQSGATPSLTTSYNVTSITDTNTGQLTVTIATDFSSADWCCIATSANGSSPTAMSQHTKAAGSVLVVHFNGSTDPSAGWNVMGLGDQA